MRRILYIEWLKIRKYRAFIVLAVLSAAGIIGVSYMVRSFESSLHTSAGANPLTAAVLGKPFDFPRVWHTVAYTGSFLHILPALLMIILICNEYNFRTNRQNVIDGMSRGEFMWGKTMLAVVMALAMSLMVFITACIFGLQGKAGFSFEGLEYVGFSFVQLLAHIGVAMVLATLFKRSGMAIGMYILYVFIVENVLRAILKYGMESGLSAFLPLNSSDKLIPAPMINMILPNNGLPAKGWFFAVACAWIVLEMWFCRWKFCRKDI